MILGVFGPFQLLVLLLLPVGIIIGLIVVFASRAKHKSKAETLSSVLDSKQAEQSSSKQADADKLSKLERLNKLKQEGALTEEEFAREKAKVLG